MKQMEKICIIIQKYNRNDFKNEVKSKSFICINIDEDKKSNWSKIISSEYIIIRHTVIR